MATTSEPIRTGHELYREISNRGLHIRLEEGRDNALLRALCKRLGCPDDKLMRFLQEEKVSAEDFFRAFLAVVQPFSQMFTEIWDYLAEHAAPRARESLRVRFGKTDDSIQIDLDQFREYVKTSERVFREFGVSVWNQESLRALFDVQRTLAGASPRPMRDWGAYKPGEPYSLPSLRPPKDEFERMIQRVHDVFELIIDRYAALHVQRKHLLPELNETMEAADEGTEENLRPLAWLLTDLIPGWNAIFDYAPHFTSEQRRTAVEAFREHVEPRIRAGARRGSAAVLAALDVLNMPFWKQRWHTYEIWATVVVLRALAECEPKPRVVDGRIAVDGSINEIVGDLAVASHPDACVRVQFETPFEEDDRKAIRPDLSICFDKRLTADSRAVVVEFKQRAHLEKSHVETVGRHYVRGSPRAAGVLILNYDETGIRVDLSDPDVRDRLQLLEGVQPLNPEAVQRFEHEVQRIVRAAGLTPRRGLVVVLLDVSASMHNQYTGYAIQQALTEIVRIPWLKVLRFSEGLLPGGILSEEDISEFETEGGTDLSRAYQETVALFGKPDALLVVTDGGYGPWDPTHIANYRECQPDELAESISWLREIDRA